MNGDPAYLRYLKALLNHVDRAMQDEGVPPDVRDRVISRLSYGTPAPDVEPAAEPRRLFSQPRINAIG